MPGSYLEEKEHKCLKSLQSSFCILHPACILLSICNLHFTLSLHFAPGWQSAVRSLCFTLTAKEIENQPRLNYCNLNLILTCNVYL